MIQLNLLPDVKLEYIKAQRTRGLMLTVSFLVTAVAVGLLVILLIFGFAQKSHLKDLNADIKTESSELKNKPEISKKLTVQNQLKSLTALHAQKPAASSVFTYLNQVTPTQVSINSYRIDFAEQTMSITGTADTLSSVNQYVDTLKYTRYSVDGTKDRIKAFSNVVLAEFSLNAGQSGTQAASYTVSFSYDIGLFDNTKAIKLDVPSLTTTRAGIDQPPDLFQAAPASTSAKKEGN
jgi:Tfp pilus assembly protein PilN